MLYKGIHINDDLIEKYNQQYMGEFQSDIFDTDILKRTCKRAGVEDIEEGIKEYGQETFENMVNDVLEEVSECLVYPETIKIRGLDIEKDLLDTIFHEDYDYTEKNADFKEFTSNLICTAYYRMYGKDMDNADLILELSKDDQYRMNRLSTWVNIILRETIKRNNLG